MRQPATAGAGSQDARAGAPRAAHGGNQLEGVGIGANGGRGLWPGRPRVNGWRGVLRCAHLSLSRARFHYTTYMRPLCSHGHAGPRRTGGRDCVSVTRGRRAGTRVLRPRAAAHRAWALMFGTYCTIGSFECRVERAPASASGRHADGGWCLAWGLRSRFRPRALFGVSWLTGAGALPPLFAPIGAEMGGATSWLLPRPGWRWDDHPKGGGA